MRECFSHVHTCEHILNRTMVNMFGCPRSRNAHVEKKATGREERRPISRHKCAYFYIFNFHNLKAFNFRPYI